MMIYLQRNSYENADSFVNELNKTRLANKNQWLAFSGVVGGSYVELKTYGHSYLQILKVDGLNYGGLIDSKVSEWKQLIKNALEKGV